MIYALFIFNSFVMVACTALIKTYRKAAGKHIFGDCLFYCVNILVALLFFASMCKFDLRVNLVTLLFSCVFACLCYFSMFLELRALEHTTMVNAGLFSDAGALILSSLAGVLFFREDLRLRSVLGFVLTFASMLVPYFAAKKSGSGLKGLFYCMLLALNSGAVRIVMKLYHTVPGCLNENLFCFYTNLVMIPFVMFMHRKLLFRAGSFKAPDKQMGKAALIAVAAVIASNVYTLLSMVLVGKVDLFFSSVFGPPLTICINFLFDVLIFRTPVKLHQIVTIALALAAIAVTV